MNMAIDMDMDINMDKDKEMNIFERQIFQSNGGLFRYWVIPESK
jgi:hypothetical protein